MAQFSLEEAAKAVNGVLINGQNTRVCNSVSIDSRTIKRNALFVAIIGETLDGHTFLGAAFSNGALAAIISDKKLPSKYRDRAFIVVDDTTTALQELAATHRRRFPKLKVVAITGSNGKTTVKNMVAAALAKKYRTLKTEGNLNNHIGLPLTLLRLTKKDEAAVVEMGMNHKGEIARLAQLAAPTVGLITNISQAHIGAFKSLAGVRNAKGELLDALKADGVAILNGDDKASLPLIKRAGKKALVFGEGKNARVQMVKYEQNEKGAHALTVLYKKKRHLVTTPLLGACQPQNVLATFAAASVLGVRPDQIAKALGRMKPEAMRMEPVKLKNGTLVINDAYNANPASVEAALATVASIRNEGQTIFAFGQMEELGAKSLVAHKNVGKAAARYGVDFMVTYGKMAHEAANEAAARSIKTVKARSHKQVARAIHKRLKASDVALIKGSRKAKMEEALACLMVMEEEN